MNIETIKPNETNIALITSQQKEIIDAQSALDLIMTLKYETNAEKIGIDKEIITEDFFKLNTGIAGEILQKCVNYHIKVAIWGDYSHYTSKPLKDFIKEANRGKDFFFVETKEEAIQKLIEA